MQRLGQHFLKNKSILEKIVAALGVSDGDSVIEIGPGHGELTELLLQKNVHLTAIEKDRLLIEPLRKKFVKEAVGPEIVEGDALKLLGVTVDAKLNNREGAYNLVGNIPYYITGKLLRIISDLKIKPIRTVLLIQREVAERICAEPPKMNRLAASVQYWATPKIVGNVSRENFSPPPEVDSAIILLERRVGKDAEPGAEDRYYSAVRALFAQPRKTVLNNLSAAGVIKDKKVAKQEISRLLEEIPVSPEARPQNLSITDLSAIAELLF